MSLYQVEIDKSDGSVLTAHFNSLEEAKSMAQIYNEKYGCDVYIKEISTIYLRKAIIRED